MSVAVKHAWIRYRRRVLYGTSTLVPTGTEVEAEIHDNGNAWWFRGDQQYLVYPDEFEIISREET